MFSSALSLCVSYTTIINNIIYLFTLMLRLKQTSIQEEKEYIWDVFGQQSLVLKIKPGTP